MLPVLLDLSGRTVLVVGGGPVGRRKADAARAAGALVRLVCREPRPAGLDDAALDWHQVDYAPAHLDGAALAFAAATPPVNARVAADARSRGIWVNVASELSAGDLLLPSTLRRGGLLLAVSTGGAAPALARRLRQQLETQFDDAHAAWVTLLAELRPRVLRQVIDAGARRRLFEQLTDESWLERLRQEGTDPVRQAMAALLKAVSGEA